MSIISAAPYLPFANLIEAWAHFRKGADWQVHPHKGEHFLLTCLLPENLGLHVVLGNGGRRRRGGGRHILTD